MVDVFETTDVPLAIVSIRIDGEHRA